VTRLELTAATRRLIALDEAAYLLRRQEVNQSVHDLIRADRTTRINTDPAPDRLPGQHAHRSNFDAAAEGSGS
jgi:hypothetical protein